MGQPSPLSGREYIDEIGYDGLYDCIAVADAEIRRWRRAAQRALTDLRTNGMTTAADVVAHPDRCRARFSPARWSDFKTDVAFFRAGFPTPTGSTHRRSRLQRVAGLAADRASARGRRPGDDHPPRRPRRLDPLLMLAAFAAVAWAFGWERAALVAVVWGTLFPGAAVVDGGIVLALGLVGRAARGSGALPAGEAVAGGALLGYAALSRVFPVFALAGAALAAGGGRAQAAEVDPAIARRLAGAAVATALLVPIAGAVRSGPGWSEFTRNLAKHTSVPSPNRMGLAAVVAFEPAATHRAFERRRVRRPFALGIVAGAVAARPARGLGAARAAWAPPRSRSPSATSRRGRRACWGCCSSRCSGRSPATTRVRRRAAAGQ